MNKHWTQFLLSVALALGAVTALAYAFRPAPEKRNFEVFTEMAYSKAYESYTPNPNFSNGRTMQPLVEGVVPRGHLPFPYGTGPDEAKRAGQELKNPISAQDAKISTFGAELYRIACVVCHDARGNGKGTVTQRGMLPPPSLHGRAKQLPDGELFHILTKGQGNMANYAAELSEQERWLIVHYIRQLQKEGP